jgi:predicted DNA-binding transcriptional regulator AlpA
VNLLGTHEIAELLAVSRQRVQQLAEQRGFPKPVAHLRAGKIWRKRDIERWAERREERRA